MVQDAKKFELEGYNLSLIGKNFSLTDSIRDYAMEKVSKIERFTDHILDIAITLDTQKLEHSCSMDVKFLHYKIRAHASMDDIYSAIDKASARLVRLIQKYKTKLQERKVLHASVVDLKVNVFRPSEDELAKINDEIESESIRKEEEKYQFHQIVSKKSIPLHMLTHAEAVMRIELSGDEFLLFKSEEDQKLKIIYRRKDKNFGIIEVE